MFAVRIADGAPTTATGAVHATGATAAFTLSATDAGSWGNTITYTVVNKGTQAAPKWVFVVAAGQVKETYTGANVGAVHDAIAAATSQLVTIAAVSNPTSGFDTVATRPR